MKSVREQIEEAIWRSSNDCNDSTLWFDPMPYSNSPRVVDELLDRIERIIESQSAPAPSPP